jgi:hypothetical protein
MRDVEIRRFTKGDRLRSLYAKLQRYNTTTKKWEAVDLTGATVKFRMVDDSDDSVKVDDKDATVDDATEGQVSYSWADADIDTAGNYWGWIIRVSGGQTEHFPAGHGFKIVIEDTV